jgi:hypothetical protein
MMKNIVNTFPKFLVAAAVMLAITATQIGIADAGGSRSVDRSWSKGSASGSMSKSVTRGNGSWSRDATRTGPNGNTIQRSTQRSSDPESGSGSFSTTTTLPSGETATRSRSVTRTESGIVTERQVSGPGGSSRSVTRTIEVE